MALPPICFVTPDGALAEAHPLRGVRTLARAWPTASGPSKHAWPSPAPDGRRIACFVHPEDEGAPHEVVVCDAETGALTQLFSRPDARPVYLSWARDDRIALLVQAADEPVIELYLMRADEPGRGRVLLRDAPLFIAWSPDRESLAVHAGRGAGSRVVVRALEGDAERVVSERPGRFRVPALGRRGELVVVEHGDDEGVEHVVRVSPGEERERLLSSRGPLALRFSDDGGRLAIGVGAGEPLSYGRIHVVEAGGARELAAPHAAAFGWLPSGDALWTLGVEASEMCLVLGVVDADGGGHRELGRFLPASETLFELSFFDQYADSHPRLSPGGEALLFCGHATASGGTGEPKVFVVPLDSGAPEAIAEGCAAVWRAPR